MANFEPPVIRHTCSLLLSGCLAVLYTPDKEHFGIVPLECMVRMMVMWELLSNQSFIVCYNYRRCMYVFYCQAAGRPVIAVKSGGPMETVVHGATGFLCPPDEEGGGSHYY